MHDSSFGNLVNLEIWLCSVFSQQLIGSLGRDGLMEIVPDRGDRSRAGGSEALNELDRVFLVRAGRDAVSVRFARAALFPQVIAERVASGQRAGKRPANLDLDLADRMFAEHRVESHQLENIDRLDFQLRRDPFDPG